MDARRNLMSSLGSLAFCLLVLFCGSGPPVAAQESDSDSNTATTIRALEHEWADAQSRNDNRALDLIFDNELIYVEYGRLVSKSDYLARIKNEAPVGDAITMEVLTVKTHGHTALVIGTYSEKVKKTGRRDVKRWRFVDTWVYHDQGWRLVAAAATLIK